MPNDRTSYVEGSRAKTSVAQESKPASMESDQDSGVSLRGSFAHYDRDSLSWRTSQLCLDGGLSEFSETWPRAGMMRNGIAFQLQPSAPLTDVIGSSSLHTPTATGNQAAPSMRGRDRGSWYPTQATGESFSGTRGGGHVNPRWVEWLMGFPDGWTELER